MTDNVDTKTRSRMMRGIRATDTKPELVIRKGLHAMGFRYRLYEKRLPGCPDLYFPMYKAIIQVHGCFWHKHDCKYFKWPQTRSEFWREKLEKNAVRDENNQYRINSRGLRSLIIWECALRGKKPKEIGDVLTDVSSWLTKGTKDQCIPRFQPGKRQ